MSVVLVVAAKQRQMDVDQPFELLRRRLLVFHERFCDHAQTIPNGFFLFVEGIFDKKVIKDRC